MEFKLEKVETQEIKFNFLEIKTELTNSLEKYKNLVYTDEQIKEAKTDRAKLNKFKEALDTKRKEIKKMCLAPYNEFESKVKELLALVDEPINAIDTQVKTFEDKKAQAKKEELEKFFNDIVYDLKNVITFDKIFSIFGCKWLNTTYTIKKCKEDIIHILADINACLEILRNLKLSENIELQVINKYLENCNLTEALAEKTKLEALKSNLTTLENKTNETIKEDVKPVLNDNADTYKVVFEVEATKEQLQMIKRFLIENNIKYGSVK